MRIEDTHIQQQAPRHIEGHGRKDGLEAAKEPRESRHHDHDGVHRHKRPDSVDISDEARARLESMHKRSSEARGREIGIPAGLDHAGFLGRLLRGAFKGQDINITDVFRAGQGQPSPAAVDASGAPSAEIQGAAGTAPADGVSATAASTGFSASVEKLSFSASGTIKTADGEEVGFTLELNMTKASMSGFSAGASGGAQDPLAVNFAGTSSELFSLSFEFNIASGEDAGTQDGSGLLTVDRHDENSGEIDEERHGEHDGEVEEDGGQTGIASSVPDFLKALRKADFTSTYLSFSKTTMEVSSYLAVAEGAPFDGFVPGALPSSSVPVDLMV
jgi:hypothetical protein